MFDVSIGYDVPWHKVHELLLKSAKTTPGVMADPEPFVLETELQNWYPVYQINAYIKETDQLTQIFLTCIKISKMYLQKRILR